MCAAADTAKNQNDPIVTGLYFLVLKISKQQIRDNNRLEYTLNLADHSENIDFFRIPVY